MTQEEPETCPACDEPFEAALPPDVDRYERDDDGRVTGPNPDADVPENVQRQCSIGSDREYAGWNFFH